MITFDMNNQILVLGYFGYESNKLDGQTVKTRNVYALLSQLGYKPTIFDTEDFRHSILSVWRMVKRVCCSDKIVYLPAHNNLKYIFPVIYLLAVIFRSKIHYFVVGGWLSEYLRNKPLHRFLLKRISGIHPETNRLKAELETEYGFNNVSLFPNFRLTDFIQSASTREDGKLRAVFMARINKMKGLDMIDQLCDNIVATGYQDKLTITFYGPIAPDDKSYFDGLVDAYSFVNYEGVLQPGHIHSTLQNYDVLLLPTRYYTEGIPGSLIDAYIAGIPVIATRWKHHAEIIDSKTGIVVPFSDGQEEFNDAVKLLIDDRDLLAEMKNCARAKGESFTQHNASNILRELIES